jgi:hypothetical protein
MMTEYVAFDPHVEVKAVAAQPVIDLVGPDMIPILQQNHIASSTTDQWIWLQDWLNTLKDLEALGALDLVTIGMGVPDNAIFPPEIQDVENALRSINMAYQMNHRGGEIGEYVYDSTGPTSGTMFCRNPYPSDFDFGLLHGIIRKFRPATARDRIIVQLDPDKPTRKQGADSCTFLLSW